MFGSVHMGKQHQWNATFIVGLGAQVQPCANSIFGLNRAARHSLGAASARAPCALPLGFATLATAVLRLINEQPGRWRIGTIASSDMGQNRGEAADQKHYNRLGRDCCEELGPMQTTDDMYGTCGGVVLCDISLSLSANLVCEPARRKAPSRAHLIISSKPIEFNNGMAK